MAYYGHLRGGHIVVGLFDCRKAGTPLAYWVNLEEPGGFLLEGIEPGEYELHACVAPRINGEGMPVDVLACGSWEQNRRMSFPSKEAFGRCNFTIYDEIPSGILQGMDTVFVDVTNVDRAVRFFRDILGLNLLLRDDSWAEFDTGSTRLAIRAKEEKRDSRRARAPEPLAGSGAVVVFRVEDLPECRQELIERGVEFTTRIVESTTARWSTFQDPDGNQFQIFEKK